MGSNTFYIYCMKIKSTIGTHHYHLYPMKILHFHWLLQEHVMHHMTPVQSHIPAVLQQSLPVKRQTQIIA